MKLCREQADPGGLVTAGGGQMWDTEARCRHQDVRGYQAMADQAFQGFVLPGPHPSAAQPERRGYENRLDHNSLQPCQLEASL